MGGLRLNQIKMITFGTKTNGRGRPKKEERTKGYSVAMKPSNYKLLRDKIIPSLGFEEIKCPSNILQQIAQHNFLLIRTPHSGSESPDVFESSSGRFITENGGHSMSHAGSYVPSYLILMKYNLLNALKLVNEQIQSCKL